MNDARGIRGRFFFVWVESGLPRDARARGRIVAVAALGVVADAPVAVAVEAGPVGGWRGRRGLLDEGLGGLAQGSTAVEFPRRQNHHGQHRQGEQGQKGRGRDRVGGGGQKEKDEAKASDGRRPRHQEHTDTTNSADQAHVVTPHTLGTLR
jgi:hypothetical protein